MIVKKHEEYCNGDTKNFMFHILRREEQLPKSCWSKAGRKSKEGDRRKSHLQISWLYFFFRGIMQLAAIMSHDLARSWGNIGGESKEFSSTVGFSPFFDYQ